MLYAKRRATEEDKKSNPEPAPDSLRREPTAHELWQYQQYRDYDGQYDRDRR